MQKQTLISLQLQTTEDFTQNLEVLKKELSSCQEGAIILAPELFLSEFAYTRMDEAASFSQHAIKEIKALSQNKTIGLSFITKKDNKFFNSFYLFNNQKIIHTQDKAQLFPLGNEQEHFAPGDIEDMKIIELNGLKIAVLICFEIRFPKYWERVKGADIILNPAMWGVKRKDHYESITKALALINQCFVLASNSANDNMAKGSAIISPFGDVLKDDQQTRLIQEVNLEEIKKVRKYIDIGLNQ